MTVNQIHIYISAQVLTIFSTVAIAVFIFFRGRQRETARLYAFYNLAIAAWAFAWIQMAQSSSPSAGLFWSHFIQVPTALIPPTFLHFVLSLTELNRDRKYQWFLKSTYLTAAVFALLSFHKSIFVSATVYKFGLLYFPSMGPLYPIFIVFLVIVYISGLLVLLAQYKANEGIVKAQIFYVLIAYAIGILGGAQAFLPLVSNRPIPSYAFFLIPLAQAIITHAIFRHQLLETRIFARRVALFVSIYVVLLIIAIPLIYFFHQRMMPFTNFSYSFFESVTVGIILSGGSFIYAYFVRSGSYFKVSTMSGLTHELKSPLAIIESALEAMQSEPSENLPPDYRSEYMEMMERNLSRLGLLVNDLLIVLSDKNVPLRLKRQDIAVESLIDEAVRIHADAAHRKSLVLKKILSKNLPPVNCDPKGIVQVLSNLISNSIKFTEEGYIEVKAEAKNKALFLSVSDTGPGINAEDTPYVFDRFYQGKQNKHNKGTGIGLSIAKIWVEAHGGKIWLSSNEEVKRGTSLVFTIPG